MKISQLPVLADGDPRAEVPVSLMGENFRVSLGQIAALLSAQVVTFEKATDNPSASVVDAEPSSELPIVWDEGRKGFFACSENAGSVVYYSRFQSKTAFCDSEGVRRGCIFAERQGARLFCMGEETLVQMGMTAQQAQSLERLTPIEKADEDEMEDLISSGQAVEGQFYFVAE